MSKRKKSSKFGKRLKRFFLKFIFVFFIITIIPVVIYKFFPVRFTPLMAINKVNYKLHKENVETRKSWTSIDEISINFQLAVISAEDDKFLEHCGFDFEAIQKAYKLNKRHRHTLLGGSTISQQTAKNVFLWPGRSWLRKGLELYFTILIEAIWGKERIMEVYLNVVQTGIGIYGVESASEFYYHKTASEVTGYEAAAIAAILPNPNKFSVLYPSPYIQSYRNAIFRRMSRIEQALDIKQTNNR